MKKNNFKFFLFVFFLLFSTPLFSEDYLKNQTSLQIAITNEDKNNSPVDMEVFIDNRKLISDMFLEHNNPITGTPFKTYSFKEFIGNHVIKIAVKKAKHVFSFPIVLRGEGLYIDLRYQNGESPKKQTNYKDGRILIREGHFEMVMAPPGVIGYD